MKSKDIIYLSLCIAAQDRLISDIEISRLFELLNKKIAKIKKEFENHLRSFFIKTEFRRLFVKFYR